VTAVQPATAQLANSWWEGPYDRWLATQDAPVHTGIYVEDFRLLERGWWSLRGCPAAILNLLGDHGVTEAHVLELRPGETIPPFRIALEEVIYVAEGQGLTTVWAEGYPKITFEWQKHSLFRIPMLAAGLFAHRTAGLRNDRLAGFGEDGLPADERGTRGMLGRRRPRVQVRVLGAPLLLGPLVEPSVPGELGDSLLGAVVVDQGLPGAGGGDERSDSGIVERPRQSQAGLVEARDRVISEQRVGPADQSQVVTQVLDGLAEVHRGDLVAHGNALVQRREDAQAELAGQGGLADQQQGEGAQ